MYSYRAYLCLGHQHNWSHQDLCSQKMILMSSGIWLLQIASLAEVQDWLYSGCRTITWRTFPKETSLELNYTWNCKVLVCAIALFPVLPYRKVRSWTWENSTTVISYFVMLYAIFMDQKWSWFCCTNNPVFCCLLVSLGLFIKYWSKHWFLW